MVQLPASPDLSHLKKQAKHLLRDARAGEAAALRRFIKILPAVRDLNLAALAERELQLHDAQSVIARENGFQSWTELKRYVEWKQVDRAERLKSWLRWAYEGNTRERRLAVRMLREEPEFFTGDTWLVCTGDEQALRKALSEDPTLANRPGGSLNMAPLIAVTHSRLILEAGFESGLLACARLLLEHGADVDVKWINPQWADWPLSALYGAAGYNHHAGMAILLLEAGANPNDNESLYHSVESRDSVCTRLMIDFKARVTGTNAIAHVLDYDKLDDLKLMLEHGGDAKERPWIHHAILRGRSTEHVRVLVDAGADLQAIDRDGISLFRWATLHARADVVEILRQAGVEESLTLEEQFVCACSDGDEAAAWAILKQVPEIFSRLTPKQMQIMPELAATGQMDGVRTMLAVGWPREVKAGWGATALNLAVYRGDANMAKLLLENGADWRTEHAYRNNVLGTLAYASNEEAPEDAANADFVGCARALVDHGVPLASFEGYNFSELVMQFLSGIRFNSGSSRASKSE